MSKLLELIQKKASEEQPTYSDMEKKAAFNKLMENGMGFNEALAAIEKEAGVINGLKGMGSMVAGKAKSFATAVKADAKVLPGQLRNVGTAYKANGGMNSGTRSTMKAVLKNRAVQTGAAGAAAVGAGIGAAVGGKKKDD